jgi:probable lipoprotein NlpC
MMKKSLLIFSLSFISFLFFAEAKKSHAELKAQHAICKGIILPSEDSTFIEKYSKRLGIPLDSCCNRKFIAAISEWIGCPYRAGGNTRKGTDCSGFVSSIYKEVYDINLSHSGVAMFHQMKQLVRKSEKLQEGDIMFFRKRGNRITHVAMYLRDGKFIHAATVGRGVVVDDLRTPYYRRTYMMAGRVFPTVM